MRKPARGTILSAIIPTLLLAFGAGGALAGWLDFGKEILGGKAPTTSTTALTGEEMGAGLKEALRIGSERVVGKLGRVDGFNADPAIHIPLPEKLRNAQSLLARVGMSGMLDELELKLNRAAETATPEAKELFWGAIKEMTLDDVKAIYSGPEDAATRYFQKKMSPELAASMRPVVDQSLAEVGAVQTYNQLLGQVGAIPFAPDIKADLTGYVVDRGMDGIFHYLAVEEAAIRQDPAKRTTDLLKKVFGGG